MNLVEQIFEQAKLGTAVDPSANPFALGVQLGQGQQRINMEKQRLAEELAQAPLQRTLLELDGQTKAANLDLFLQNRKLEADAAEAFAGLAAVVTPLMATGKIDEAQNLIMAEANRNAVLLADPKNRLKSLFDMTTRAQDTKVAIAQARNAGLGFTPQIRDVPNPDPTKPGVQVLQKSPGEVVLLPGSAPTAPSTAEKNFNRLDQLQQALNVATASGDPAAIANAQRQLDTFSALATPPAETMTFDAKTGAVTISKGKNPNNLTSANTTRLQEGLQSAVANIDIANRLEPLISSETVGARAFAESWIKDRVLAQAFPELASNKRATAETLAAQLRSATVQQLKSDGNISDREQKQILQAIPEINSPIDSPARARQLIQASRRMAAIHAVVAATKLNDKIPRAAAQTLSTSELKRLVDTGVLTKEQALAAFDAASAPQ